MISIRVSLITGIVFSASLHGMQKPIMRRSMSDGDNVTILSINSVSLDDMRENLLSPSDICPVPKSKSNKKTRSCFSKLCAHKGTMLACGACAVLIGSVWIVASKLEGASDRLNGQLHTAQHDITICQNMIDTMEVVKQACMACINKG